MKSVVVSFARGKKHGKSQLNTWMPGVQRKSEERIPRVKIVNSFVNDTRVLLVKHLLDDGNIQIVVFSGTYTHY